jgi:hypothetical protein
VQRSIAVPLALLAATASVARADHSPPPTSVAVAGSFQSELGCPGDWQPECALTESSHDATDDVWRKSFTIPLGAYEYKIALNDSWDESYPLGSQRTLALAQDPVVTFYYDHALHFVSDTANDVVATAAGSFQSELGCPGDWDPGCLRSWLRDVDHDGLHEFTTTAIPLGSYESKIAIDESWDENYGVGGAPGGANYAFAVVAPGDPVTFRYDEVTHVLEIDAPEPGANACALFACAALVARRRSLR